MKNQNQLPEGYTLQTLDLSDLPALLALQDIVVGALPAGEKNFICKKTPQQFASRMAECGVMHGLFSHQTLVAYGSVVFPVASWPIGDMVMTPDGLNCPPEKLGVIQSSAVHPDHRKQNLHDHLIKAREEVCLKQGRTHFVAEVAAENPASLKGFLHCGYHVIGGGYDPEDQCKLLYVSKEPAQTASLWALWGEVAHNVLSDFSGLLPVLAKGARGIGINKNGQGTHGYDLLLKTPTCG